MKINASVFILASHQKETFLRKKFFMGTTKRFRKLLFGLLVMLILLLLMEVSGRIAFFFKFRNINTSLSVQGNALQQRDPSLIFRNRPFYTDYKFGFQNNEEGLKSKPGDTEMPAKTDADYWVFLFGASAMEGMGSNKDGEWLDITGIRDRPYEASIAFLLQQQLQKKMPDKKISIFSAANSGFSILQSQLQYQRLKTRYAIDFVISMDGVNEPLIQNNSPSVKELIQANWNAAPVHHAPLRYIIPFTKNSALLYWMKQGLFESKMSARLRKALKNDYPKRKEWLNKQGTTAWADSSSAITRNTLDSFLHYLLAFDQQLIEDKIPHFLFIQPHLILKQPDLLTMTEKALLHYYQSGDNNNAYFNAYLKKMHNYADTVSSKTIRSLGFMHYNKFETFVDYCHFSSQANQQLADFFAEQIYQNVATGK